MPPSPYEPLDGALDALSGCATGLANGNFNHAPMVAEALCALGRPEAVMPWLERYRGRLLPRTDSGVPIDRSDWRAALGQRDRFAAWSALFADELSEAPWSVVLDRWAGSLAPGASAAATHGVIRVGHAVRALTVGESPQRRRELADALASWAASYTELPAADLISGARLAPVEALRKVPVVPPDRRRPGNIAAALAGLAEFSEFAPAVALVDLDGDIEERLAELTDLFTGVYLANVDSPLTAIVFIHGVTSLTALGHIAKHVTDETTRLLLRYGWQAGCGLYACFGGAGVTRNVTATYEGCASLVDQAVSHGDEHVIKFAEACLTRHRLKPSPAYPAAVASVLRMIGRR